MYVNITPGMTVDEFNVAILSNLDVFFGEELDGTGEFVREYKNGKNGSLVTRDHYKKFNVSTWSGHFGHALYTTLTTDKEVPLDKRQTTDFCFFMGSPGNYARDVIAPPMNYLNEYAKIVQSVCANPKKVYQRGETESCFWRVSNNTKLPNFVAVEITLKAVE